MSPNTVAFIKVQQVVMDSATGVDRSSESNMDVSPSRVSLPLPTLLLSKELNLSSCVKLQLGQRAFAPKVTSTSRGVPLKLQSSFAPPPGLSTPWIDESEEPLPKSNTISDISTQDPADTPHTSSEDGFQVDEVGYIPGRVLRFAIYQPPQELELSSDISDEPHSCEFPECPSVGSVHHRCGLCVPCDFVYRKESCRMGAACKFCHLCGRGELKQRKKQRVRAVKLARKWKAALEENACGV